VAWHSRTLFYENTRHLINNGASWAPSGQYLQVDGAFENVSTNNHWPAKRKDLKRSHALSDVGSNWTAMKTDFKTTPYYLDVICRPPGGSVGYQGPVMVHFNEHWTATNSVEWLLAGHSSEIDLIGLGATAISRVLPTNPISDLPTAVGELLTEGLPHLPGRGARSGRGVRGHVSGNYLNYEFGIRPFVSDLQKFVDASARADKLIADYAANSGRKLRREYHFTPKLNDGVDEYAPDAWGNYLSGARRSDVSTCNTPANGGFGGQLTDSYTTTIRTWFSGAFVYYLPFAGKDFSSRLLRQEAELRHLYGGLSVNTAWNLLPYSWAVDWFSNAGDVIHNVAAFAQDGLVMPHAYVMQKYEYHIARTLSGSVIGSIHPEPGVSASNGILPPITSTWDFTYMRRRKATPFGFGLTTDALTTRQQAILVALGVSRS